jgi:hypothetical protein
MTRASAAWGDVPGRVQGVDGGLDEDPAAGELGVVLPGQAPGLQALLEGEAGEGAEVAPAGHEGLHQGVEAEGLGHHEEGAGVLHGLAEGLALRHGAGEGLLQEERAARGGHRLGHREVQAGRDGHHHRVHLGGEGLGVIGRAHPEAGRRRRPLLRVPGVDGGQGGPGHVARGQVVGVAHPVTPEPDETDPDHPWHLVRLARRAVFFKSAWPDILGPC